MQEVEEGERMIAVKIVCFLIGYATMLFGFQPENLTQSTLLFTNSILLTALVFGWGDSK